MRHVLILSLCAACGVTVAWFVLMACVKLDFREEFFAFYTGISLLAGLYIGEQINGKSRD